MLLLQQTIITLRHLDTSYYSEMVPIDAILWTSSGRIVRFSMGGQTYAFPKEFYCKYAIKNTLEKLYRQIISIATLTDSKQIFYVVTKASHAL